VADFDAGRGRWLARLGNLRNVVRQEVVARQLAAHVGPAPRRVLDIGCGQGTQALRLAHAGHEVVGLDPSEEMLDAFRGVLASEPPEVVGRVRLVRADGVDAPEAAGTGGYDAVLLHGVLMYLDDPGPMLAAAVSCLRPGGVLSVVARNGSSLAMRPGMRGQWADALAAFDATTYRNEIGVDARADSLDDMTARLSSLGLELEEWYGVRTFSDRVSVDEPAPTQPRELAALLDAEERAGRTDPYRGVATLLHVLARRPVEPVT
jgi:SAM-dependent methyltransferase